MIVGSVLDVRLHLPPILARIEFDADGIKIVICWKVHFEEITAVGCKMYLYLSIFIFIFILGKGK